ncbi:MAG: hypothetical protein KOO62_08380 [candidate division Zixibacteria bacterium]|nr:hypothetical protein [candidate division Zixibacteria bacterium]
MDNKTIESVLEKYTRQLMSLPGVTGTGLGLCDGIPCIKVFVAGLTEETKKEIPDQLEGHQVKIEESGTFTAY